MTHIAEYAGVPITKEQDVTQPIIEDEDLRKEVVEEIAQAIYQSDYTVQVDLDLAGSEVQEEYEKNAEAALGYLEYFDLVRDFEEAHETLEEVRKVNLKLVDQIHELNEDVAAWKEETESLQEDYDKMFDENVELRKGIHDMQDEIASLEREVEEKYAPVSIGNVTKTVEELIAAFQRKTRKTA